MVSDRLQAWVRARFGPSEAEAVLDLLADLVPLAPGSSAEGIERIQAAVVLLSGGDSRRFLDAVALAQEDWRDVLVEAGLADGDWVDELNATLGDSSKSERAGRQSTSRRS
ncbi:hypothetical protein [Micromonospora sp. KC213]|uniref:hypothetical protein n=1 Tax=Micromonospora sp. KC213 TaxID=2530378 RepID=UPI001051BDC7|nr:hypothetical protein [Micromonospora sp. KC213]TDC37089.1 hypothetical protein E1166_20930 [Micromonospora sp. KC213]